MSSPKRIASFMLTALMLLSSPLALANQLLNHPSPYLALHGNDPVAWQIWGEKALAKARQENKLIFISSGYFACHWCHVMQKESFQDKAVADLLNRISVPVKLDRELSPALDAWLIDFTEKTAGQAGWPLNVFLTPDGHPLVGMTYMPRDRFNAVVKKLATRWKSDAPALKQVASLAFETMRPAPDEFPEQALTIQDVTRLVQGFKVQVAMQADDIAGGFGDQNKFPMSPQLMTLLDVLREDDNVELKAFLHKTLLQMANLGLWDHINGGFFRYVVDPAWETPHFEKMLYDNAQLAKVYAEASVVLNEPQFLQVAQATLGFVMRHMLAKEGGYIASLSAIDDKGEEGGYYLWQVEELQQFLNVDEMQLVEKYWGVSGAPYLPAGHHLKIIEPLSDVASSLKWSQDKTLNTLASAHKKMQQAQRNRVLPEDDKVLGAWNGLLLSAFASVYEKTGGAELKVAGDKLASVLSQRLWNGKSLQRYAEGGEVSLEDYAYVSLGLYAWAKITANAHLAQTARTIALTATQQYLDEEGWQLAVDSIIPYGQKEHVLVDGALPSPSSVMLATLRQMHRDGHSIPQALLADKLLATSFEPMNKVPFYYATQLSVILKSSQDMMVNPGLEK